MTTYPQLQDYTAWLDLSLPKEEQAGHVFFPEIAKILDWPEPVYAVPGSPRKVLESLGVGAGDYLILPNLSPAYWAAAAKAIGADCILIDNHPEHWQLDLDLLEEFLMNFSMLNEQDEVVLKKDSRIIRSMILPHLLGGMCDMERLAFIAQRFNLRWGEDITQALGSSWNDMPAGSFGSVNYCDFILNPVLPFGQPVVFSANVSSLSAISEKNHSIPPIYALANQLGRQLVSKLPVIIAAFQQAEENYRQFIPSGELKWMNLAAKCRSNGLSPAFTGQKEYLMKAIPFGRLYFPLYRQSPFSKSLYIRREDWSGRLYDAGLVLPLSFKKGQMADQVIDVFQTEV